MTKALRFLEMSVITVLVSEDAIRGLHAQWRVNRSCSSCPLASHVHRRWSHRRPKPERQITACMSGEAFGGDNRFLYRLLFSGILIFVGITVQVTVLRDALL